MKKTFRLFLTIAILVGLVSPIYSKDFKTKEEITVEYKNLLADIDEHLTISEGSYTYNYENIRNLVYNFDISSANEHLGGDWTHETFLSEIIMNIDTVDKISELNNNDYIVNAASNCQINSVDGYWNYYRIWADQSKSNTLANRYISAANITGGISVVSEFLAEGFKAVGLMGYSATASVVSMLAGYHSGHRSSLANSIKNNNWSCGTMHEIDKFFAHVWKVEAQGIR